MEEMKLGRDETLKQLNVKAMKNQNNERNEALKR
jgi:hypothetical protein